MSLHSSLLSQAFFTCLTYIISVFVRVFYQHVVFHLPQRNLSPSNHSPLQSSQRELFICWVQ